MVVHSRRGESLGESLGVITTLGSDAVAASLSGKAYLVNGESSH